MSKESKYTLIGSLFVVPLTLSAGYASYRIGIWDPLNYLALTKTATPSFGQLLISSFVNTSVILLSVFGTIVCFSLVLGGIIAASSRVGIKVMGLTSVIKTKEVDPKAGQLSHPDLVATTLERPPPPPQKRK